MEHFTIPNPYDPEDDYRRKALADFLQFLILTPGALQALKALIKAQLDLDAATSERKEPEA